MSVPTVELANIQRVILEAFENIFDTGWGAAHRIANLHLEARPFLLETVRHGSDNQRACAAYAIGLVWHPDFVTDQVSDPEELIAALLAALDDPVALVRAEGLEALARTRDTTLVPHLVPLLRDADEDVRTQATWAIKQCGGGGVVPELLAYLKWEDTSAYEARWYCVDALGESGDERAVQPLLNLLSDKREPQRHDVARALVNLQDSMVIPNLVSVAEDLANHHHVRLAAAEAVGTIRGDGPAPELVGLLDAEDALVRSGAVDVLAPYAAEPEILNRLAVLVHDSDPAVRESVAGALSAGGNTVADDALLRLLDDNNRFVRREVIRRLWNTTATWAIPALEPLLESGDAMIRAAALGSYAALVGQGAEPVVRSALVDPDPDVRQSAVYAFDFIDMDDGVDLLVDALHDPDPDVGHAAMEVLAEKRDPEVLARMEAILITAPKSPEADTVELEELRVNAILVGRASKNSAAMDILLAGLQDISPEVRRVAADALFERDDAGIEAAMSAALSDGDLAVRATAATWLWRQLARAQMVEPDAGPPTS